MEPIPFYTPPQDNPMPLDELHADVRQFCEKRDWRQYHTPKDLAIGLTTESSELLEHFRFKDHDDQQALFEDPDHREQIEDELADILFFLLRFADLNDIDLDVALTRKLEKNSEKYPKKEYKGSNKKYDE
jgi:NTP pyrophosphatase (non-canonical NTP hydrolase)